MATIPGYDPGPDRAVELPITVPDEQHRSDPGPGPGGRLPLHIPVTPPPGRPEPPPATPPDFAEVPQPGVA
jgi:hypothetical protein